jgi:phage-related protein
MAIPNQLILEKNKLESADPWLVLIKIALNDLASTVFKLVRNPEDVYFDDGNGSELYTSFPFELDATSTSSHGEISTLTLRVSNITRLIQPYLEELNGGIGSRVTVTVVHYDAMTLKATGKVADYADLIQEYDVLGCMADSRWVSFTLGAPSPLRQPFPHGKYLALFCRWQFDTATTPSPECNYRVDGDGLSKTTCKRTFVDCSAHDNAERFGGFVGLQTGGIRIV